MQPCGVIRQGIRRRTALLKVALSKGEFLKVPLRDIHSGKRWVLDFELTWAQNFLDIKAGSSELYKLSLIFSLHICLK